MLIEILKASNKLDLSENFGEVIFDMSVGYDLKGIKSDKVRGFIEGMLDASELIEFYRLQAPGLPGRLLDTLAFISHLGCAFFN